MFNHMQYGYRGRGQGGYGGQGQGGYGGQGGYQAQSYNQYSNDPSLQTSLQNRDYRNWQNRQRAGAQFQNEMQNIRGQGGGMFPPMGDGMLGSGGWDGNNGVGYPQSQGPFGPQQGPYGGGMGGGWPGANPRYGRRGRPQFEKGRPGMIRNPYFPDQWIPRKQSILM